MTARNPLFECLIRIRNLPEFAPFRELLASELKAETSRMLGLAEPKDMWRAQGAARAITKLQNLIENANSILEKKGPVGLANGSHSGNSP